MFALTSCEKFFTRSPWNEFDAETYFSNESQLRMYTDGFLNAWLPDYSETNGNDAYNDLIATKTSTPMFPGMMPNKAPGAGAGYAVSTL